MMMINYVKWAYRAICFYCISEPPYLNYTIQIKVAMNELNKLIIDTIAKFKDDPKEAIQVFFQLLGTQPQENHQNLRKAILFSMENMHDWSNIIKYSNKWKFTEFQKGFISRMRLRLNELPPAEELDVMEEMKRLVEKYWMTRSPKKGENVYREPIIIKALMRNAKSLAPKDQNSIDTNPVQIPQQPKASKDVNEQVPVERKQTALVKTQTVNQHHEKTHANEGSVFRGDSFGPQQADSNHSSTLPQRKQKLDPLASVTGRPPILKKKSLFENNVKITNSANDSKEEKKKEETAKGRMANSKIFNIMRKFGDRDEVKSTESWENFGKAKEGSANPIVTKANEEFPADKFNFGSNKKGSGDIDMKKITISPRRYDPTKVVKVIKNDPKEEKKPETLHEFSFASSEQKDSHSKQLQAVPSFRPVQHLSSEHPIASEEEKFVFHDNAKDSDKDQNILGENEFRSESFKKLKESTETPMFMFESKKRRSSGGNKLQEAFEVDEALNLYHADVKLRYFTKEIENRNGADTLSIFQEEFSRFLKDPEAFRV